MNRHEKLSHTVQKKWDELAQSPTLGFTNELEMLECLTKDWTDEAISNLLGYGTSTIRRRRNKHGIVSPLFQSWFRKFRRREVTFKTDK